jgi:dihydrofolate reductase
MKLTMTSFMTLDGVMQAPGGPDEDRSGGFVHGGWLAPYAGDEQFGRFIVGIFSRPSAFLLGRRTYQIFASYWPKVTDPADPIAAPLNRLPKYVASRTLDRVEWAGSTLVRDVEHEVARLKQQPGGELQVHGSPGLAQTLLRGELLDELNLVIAPIILGTGKRLFEPGALPAAFEPVGTQGTSKGLVFATYCRKGRPTYGTVGE